MKAYMLLVGCTFAILVGAFASYAAKEAKFIRIKKPFANVYEKLDPKSEIVDQASKGDHLELVNEGTSWLQVKVNDKIGWVEKRAGVLVARKPITIFSLPLGTFLFILVLLGGTIFGAYYFIQIQKKAEA
ncbi:MAG: SH3 domain-containing protein [Chitinivibrionales bacterium]